MKVKLICIKENCMFGMEVTKNIDAGGYDWNKESEGSFR